MSSVASFQIGDKVVYPNHGVGIIEQISSRTIGASVERFYLLKIAASSLKVMVPFQNATTVGLRRVVRNGEVVARVEANGGRQAEINEELRIHANSWIACRAFGVDYHLDEWGRRVFAHTSPVYVACGGDWTMTDPEGIRYIRTLVEGARDYVRHTAVRRSDQLTTHHHGEADHLAWLQRPFAEALRALDERDRR